MTGHPITWDELGLDNFKFFQPNPNSPKSAQEPTFIEFYWGRTKAIGTFFRNLFFGHPDLQTFQKIQLDPIGGLKWRQNYQNRFGYRGERLVEALGAGLSPTQLRDYDVVDRNTISR